MKFLKRQSEFTRSVVTLMTGTTIAHGIVILAMPVLTRLYSPADFSLLAVYAAIIGIVTTISCLRYNIAIPLPEHETDGAALLLVALTAATSISALLALPVLLAPRQAAAMLGQPGLESYLWMVPAGVLAASWYNALQFWTSRKKRFGLVTRTRVSRAIGGVGAQIAVGTTVASPFGLIFGHMLYSGLGVLGLFSNLIRHDRGALRHQRFGKVWTQAWAYRRFPLWSVPEALFNTAGVQLPLILIAAFVGGPEAGFLMLAMRVMGVPMSLIGSSVAQAFIVEAPARLRNGTLPDFTKRTMYALLRTGAPPLIAVGVISPFIFPLIFGEEWARAGWLVAWMTPWFVLQFVASPVSAVLHAAERVRTAMLLQAAGFLLRVGAVLAAVVGASNYAAELYAVSGLVFYAIYIAVILRIVIRAK